MMDHKIQRIRELLADALPKHCSQCSASRERPPDMDDGYPIRRNLLLSRIQLLSMSYEMAALRDTYVAAAGAADVDRLNIGQLDILANLLERSVDRLQVTEKRSHAPRAR